MARPSPEKLAAALRANLKRRKEAPGTPPEPPPGAQAPESAAGAAQPAPDPEKT